MEALDLDVVRAVPAVELRAEPDADAENLGTLFGHFSVFDTWYEIDSYWEGTFLERTAPGSFKKTIAENGANVKVLYDHGHDFSIGNKILGVPSDLREDATGPYYEVPLLDTSYVRDLLPGLRAGGYGSSFRFRVIKDEWNDEPGVSDHNPKGIPERTIKEVRLFEFGPVTFPANPDATAGVRSMTDAYYDHLRAHSPERYDELVARARGTRTPTRTAGEAPATSRSGAAGPEPREHSTANPSPRARERALRLAGVI